MEPGKDICQSVTTNAFAVEKNKNVIHIYIEVVKCFQLPLIIFNLYKKTTSRTNFPKFIGKEIICVKSKNKNSSAISFTLVTDRDCVASFVKVD